jgi:hypothetical protein
MMGVLFAYKIQPSEIENMNYAQMKYWSSWAKAINKSRVDQMEEINRKNA